MPTATIYPRNYRREALELVKLPDAPKEQTLVEVLPDGTLRYELMSPRQRAFMEWGRSTATPYYIYRLLSAGARTGSPGHTAMENLRVQLRRAGIHAMTPDAEFIQVEAFARHRLGLSDAEFRGITIDELVAQIQHKLDECGLPPATALIAS